MKRNHLLFLTVLMAAIFSTTAVYAAEDAPIDRAQQSADVLYELGLFRGVGQTADGKPIFDLEREPSREEAVTMLVRMLGKEEEATSSTWNTPFTDVSPWAEPYVGYAYENGLTKGIGETKFGGSGQVNASQYLTFVLRALGYESEKDFRWDAAWSLSDVLGICSGKYRGNTDFTRGDVAQVSHAALSAEIKHTDTKLIDVLFEGDAVPTEKIEEYAYRIEAPRTGKKSINEALIGMGPSAGYSAGESNGSLYHFYWNEEDQYSNICRYFRGLDIEYFYIGTKEETWQGGDWYGTRVELLDHIGYRFVYSVELVREDGSMVITDFMIINNKEFPVGGYCEKAEEVNEKLTYLWPKKCYRDEEENYWMAWQDTDLYERACSIFDGCPESTRDVGNTDVEAGWNGTRIKVIRNDYGADYYVIYTADGKEKISGFQVSTIDPCRIGDDDIFDALLSMNPDISREMEMDGQKWYKMRWDDTDVYDDICSWFMENTDYKYETIEMSETDMEFDCAQVEIIEEMTDDEEAWTKYDVFRFVNGVCTKTSFFDYGGE